jgi:hypothetical protein
LKIIVREKKESQGGGRETNQEATEVKIGRSELKLG